MLIHKCNKCGEEIDSEKIPWNGKLSNYEYKHKYYTYEFELCDKCKTKFLETFKHLPKQKEHKDC